MTKINIMVFWTMLFMTHSVVVECFFHSTTTTVPAPRTGTVKLKASANDVLLAAPVVAAGLAGVAVLGGGEKSIDDKTEVEKYFNGEVGFGRWNKIYSDSDEVNKVQKDIRDGHAETIERVLSWVDDDNPKGKTWCDVGCGVGSLAIPLAERGASVFASDISAAMVSETTRRAEDAKVALKCETKDMEDVTGEYSAVSCIDVMIHYPTDTMKGLVEKLTSLATDRVFVSFAPKTPQYTLLKAIGGLFPGPSKTTRAYLHTEKDVEQALNDFGFEVKRRHLTATNFYFSLLFEAVPKTV